MHTFKFVFVFANLEIRKCNVPHPMCIGYLDLDFRHALIFRHVRMMMFRIECG